MGQKAQGASTPPPRLAGPPVVQRSLGPELATQRQRQTQFRDKAAEITGNVAGGIMNAFFPGSGGVANALSNRIVREQVNTFQGNPTFEGANEPLKDWPSIAIGTAAGYAGGSAGSAVGGAVGGAAGGAGSAAAQTGAQVGGTLGSYAGGTAGNYAGGLVKQALYGQMRARQIGDILGRMLATQGGAYGALGASRSQ